MYRIMGSCNGVNEEIDVANNPDDADCLVSKYKCAFGEKWVIWVEPSK